MDGTTQSMIVLTPAQLWAGILAICGGISCIAGAIVWIYKGIKAMQSPNQKQDKRLAELEARVARHDELLANDKRHFEILEEGNRVNQRCMLALLSHDIDGNEVEGLKTAKDELQKFLINR